MFSVVAPLFAGLGLSLFAPFPPSQRPADRDVVELRGTLRFVVVDPDARFAYEGYVGWRVVANGKAYDLDLRGDPALAGLAKMLNGGTVVVRGRLVEQTFAVGRRGRPGELHPMDAMLVTQRVVHVTSLRAAGEQP